MPAASASDLEPELPTVAPTLPNEPASTVADPPSSAPLVPPAPAGAASVPVPTWSSRARPRPRWYRRRRDYRMGWVVIVLLFAGAVVSGWFVYRAFDDTDDAWVDTP